MQQHNKVRGAVEKGIPIFDNSYLQKSRRTDRLYTSLQARIRSRHLIHGLLFWTISTTRLHSSSVITRGRPDRGFVTLPTWSFRVGMYFGMLDGKLQHQDVILGKQFCRNSYRYTGPYKYGLLFEEAALFSYVLEVFKPNYRVNRVCITLSQKEWLHTDPIFKLLSIYCTLRVKAWDA